MIVLACSVLQREKSGFLLSIHQQQQSQSPSIPSIFLSSAPRTFSRGYVFFNSDKTIKSCNPRERLMGRRVLCLEQPEEIGTNLHFRGGNHN
jgi:hypothetical protein